MIEYLDKFFSKLKVWQLHSICLALIALLGWFDFATGFEAASSVFYLVPVSLSAWYLRGDSCFFYSILAAITWDGANALAGEEFSHPVLYFWNGVVRATFFFTTAILLQRLHRLLERERKMSRIDYLTGLFNTRAFEQALSAEHARSIRSEEPLGIATLDLDNFKEINDKKGHSEGDRVLVTIAHTLKDNVRRSDTIARVGGDEFALILPNCSQEDAQKVGAKLVACIRELSEERHWPIGVSVGIVILEQATLEDKVHDLLKCSDRLMYKVKEQGRNNFLVEKYAEC